MHVYVYVLACMHNKYMQIASMQHTCLYLHIQMHAYACVYLQINSYNIDGTSTCGGAMIAIGSKHSTKQSGNKRLLMVNYWMHPHYLAAYFMLNLVR